MIHRDPPPMIHRRSPWPRLSRRTAALALALGIAACRSSRETDPAVARQLLDRAQAELDAGDAERALDLLIEVREEVDVLDPDQRAREERLFDEAARRRFDALAEAPPDRLEDLFQSKLPDRLRARAGVLAAQRLLAEDSRISAFRLIKKVDQALPAHTERVAAGDVVARAGLALIRDPRRYKWLLHYWARGVQALEYLVVRYPLDPHCPEAYFALSERYETEHDYDRAIERTEDLLVYHPRSPYAVAAAVRLPYLRLLRMSRDDYDRAELERARAELEGWRTAYPGHDLHDWSGELLAQARTRLARSDLNLARFYRRVNQPYGVRLHARRALDEALDLGLEVEAASARGLLEAAGPAESVAPEATLAPGRGAGTGSGS